MAFRIKFRNDYISDAHAYVQIYTHPVSLLLSSQNAQCFCISAPLSFQVFTQVSLKLLISNVCRYSNESQRNYDIYEIQTDVFCTCVIMNSITQFYSVLINTTVGVAEVLNRQEICVDLHKL